MSSSEDREYFSLGYYDRGGSDPFGEECWTFYRRTKTLAMWFWSCSFSRLDPITILQTLWHFVNSRLLPSMSHDIPRNTCELSVKLLALSIFLEIPWHLLRYLRDLCDIPTYCVCPRDLSKSIGVPRSSSLSSSMYHPSLLVQACMNMIENLFKYLRLITQILELH